MRMPSVWILTIPVAMLIGCSEDYSIDADGTDSPRRLVIDVPARDQATFAEKRDFYVIGYFDPPLDSPGDIRIELFKAGELLSPLRVIQSHVEAASGLTPDSAIETEYGPDGSNFGVSKVPDLIKSPGGLANPSNKVVVTRDYYAGLILGGVTRDYKTTYADTENTPLTDLVAGTYILKVTGLSHALSGQSTEMEIRFGLSAMGLFRFSPAAHKDRITEYYRGLGLKVAFDPFPGFFLMGSALYEIRNRWMPNNALEVINTAGGTLIDSAASAVNHLFLYNIPSTSATYSVEMAALAASGLISSKNTTFDYYTLGEPTIGFRSRTGERQEMVSSIASFDDTLNLIFTRAELKRRDEVDESNRYWTEDTIFRGVDSTVMDGISLGANEECAVYGVVRPIPSAVHAGASRGQFTIDNRIANLRYEIVSADSAVLNDSSSTRAIGLIRDYDAAKSVEKQASLVEFKHELKPLAPGTYVVIVEGFDNDDRYVAGTHVEFSMEVRMDSVSATLSASPVISHGMYPRSRHADGCRASRGLAERRRQAWLR